MCACKVESCRAHGADDDDDDEDDDNRHVDPAPKSPKPGTRRHTFHQPDVFTPPPEVSLNIYHNIL